MAKQYETVIGLEVHVELATKSKIFCGCSTRFGGAPNTQTCPVCAGFPGALPVLNRQVVEYAAAVGLACNCHINRLSRFDRKNYFYPDNPQNYQISQFYIPICQDGWVEIDTPAGPKKIGIHEIHMEEDAGKLIHDEWEESSLVDFNRSGVPLIEIVSEADMRNAQEVIAYLEKLRSVIQYLGVSDCRLQEGSMRADVNLSVREVGSSVLGTRTEMKNLNSFKAITHAIDGERERQIELLEAGQPVIQETRRWDENKESSRAMRSKEDAKDYRYFPEPDLPPVVISEEWLEAIRSRQPEFAHERVKRYQEEYKISEKEAVMVTEYRNLADIFEETARLTGNPKKSVNWMTGETMRLINDRGFRPEKIRFNPAHLAALIQETEKGELTNQGAREVFEQIFDRDQEPMAYIEEKGLRVVKNDGLLMEAVQSVIDGNPDVVSQYREGKVKVLGFLMGQVMKAMKGKADPEKARQMMEEILKQ